MLVYEDNVNVHQAVIKRLERFVNLREVIIRATVFNGQELQTGVDNILRLPSIRKVSLVKFRRKIDITSSGLEELYIEEGKYITVGYVGQLSCPNLKILTLAETNSAYFGMSCLFHDKNGAFRRKLAESCPRLEIYNGYPLADLCRQAGTVSWLKAFEVLGTSGFPDCGEGCVFCPVLAEDTAENA